MKIVIVSFQKGIKILNRVIAISMALIVFLYSIRIAVMSDKGYVEAVAEPTFPVFVIDAGHGGEDPGAIGVNGVYEKDLNLSIALEIGEQLKSKGYRVVYTRTDDKMLYSAEENIKGFRKLSDLKNRCRIAKENQGCIFISIHMNSYAMEKYYGLQAYYRTTSEESRLLAQSIQEQVRNRIQPENNRAIKKGNDIYLLENYDGVAVLLECGFLTNTEECQKLSEKEYQKELSFSIVCGIIEYITQSN